MATSKFKGLKAAAALTPVVLILAACEIQLRGDESPTHDASSLTQQSDPLTAKLQSCRTVTYEQKAALSKCRKIWADERRQFLGQKNGSPTKGSGAHNPGLSSSAPPKDQSRLPAGLPSTPMKGE